ncbi:carbohydrate ABC transporter permease [Streptomyces sp. NPDC051320]|uniref:carbohydrate ABC transporter permease n=1 Tax=Streptomyces sp. NPDC051320 TaxID=3154644 RepID=UPI003425DF75
MSTTATARPERLKQQTSPLSRRPGFLTYAVLIAALLASVFPLYYSFVVPTRDNSVIGDSALSLTPGGHLFENIHRVFDKVDFWLAIRNSLIISTTVTVCCVLLASLAGFAFAKLPFRGRGALFLIVVITAMLPTQLGVVPLYMLMGHLGWIATLPAVIGPALVSAFAVFWMRQACEESVPYELVEAARIDGCSTLGTFWHVALPAIRPQASVLAMFTFMGAWNDFMWPLIVLDPSESPTVQTALSSLAAGYSLDYTLILSGAALGVLPLIVIFILLSRQIVAGVMQGAVKG